MSRYQCSCVDANGNAWPGCTCVHGWRELPEAPRSEPSPSAVQEASAEALREMREKRRVDPITNAEARAIALRALTDIEAERSAFRQSECPTEEPDPRLAELQADAMIAHRWFEKHFGEVMNGRDFAVKCEMADRSLAELLAAARDAAIELDRCGIVHVDQRACNLASDLRAAAAAFEAKA